MPTLDEYINEIKDLWDSHWLTNMGIKHQELQCKLTSYLGVNGLELLTNGHMAIELSLQALGLTNGEVITTPFTFASTTHAIVRNGLIPVFCDIDPNDYTIDASKVENLVNDKTVAILPVHVYGNVCNVEKIDYIAQKYGLKVIYDAAHAFGVTYNGHGIGSFGDVSCFSFHATKVFNTIEGGAVCFSDKDFGEKIYQLKNFGIKDEENIDGIGANAKMNEFCAAMGLCNLLHINEEINKRKKIVEHYKLLLNGLDGLQIQKEQKYVESNYAYFPIVIEEKIFGASRNEIYCKLKENGIFARKYFYPLTNTFACYKDRFDVSETPIALHISNRVLTLPLYADLTESDVEKICNIIINCKH